MILPMESLAEIDPSLLVQDDKRMQMCGIKPWGYYGEWSPLGCFAAKTLGAYGQGSGISIFTEWASRLPMRMEVAFGHLLKLSP